MPRPTDQGMASSNGFGPAPGSSENLGSIDVSPIHSLDVDGATEGAKQLAAVFEKAGGLASKVVNQQIDKAQAAALAKGEMDGTTGNVDQDQMQSSIMGMASQYATGVERAQTTLAATTAAAKEKSATETTVTEW